MEAWESGAKKWTLELRTKFGNDPNNFPITHRAINSKKADLTVVDFKRWAPPRLDECRFASYYAKVKDEYGPSFTSDEIDYYKKLHKDGCALRDRVITKGVFGGLTVQRGIKTR
jgi:hypothetical protein